MYFDIIQIYIFSGNVTENFQKFNYVFQIESTLLLSHRIPLTSYTS